MRRCVNARHTEGSKRSTGPPSLSFVSRTATTVEDSAHLYAIALTARVGGYTPVRDHLVTHSSLLILVMSCAESIGDSAHPLIMLSAVAIAATSLGSLTTLPDPHPSR